MDIAIQKKRLPGRKKYIVLLALLLIPVALLLVRFLWALNQSDLSIDGDTISFGEVKRGDFKVSVRGSGVLVPDNIQWLSAEVEATVVRRVLKAGNTVLKGDLIMELSNPQLEQQLIESQWELEAMEEESKAAQVAQESQLLELKSTVLNAKLEYERALTEYQARAELMKIQAVSKLDLDRSRVELDQSVQLWQSSEEQLIKQKENLEAQNKARSARLSQFRKRVERIQQQVESLQVKATMDSIILDVPLEPGQRIVAGDNIAKLAEQNSLIAELQIPEIQIRFVTIGQEVIIDTRNNTIKGSVSRVDPAVVNGSVLVDVELSGDLPDDARPDLSVAGEIKIAEISDTLYVERPLFVQSQSEAKLYKLSSDKRFAQQTLVELGHGSVSQIQIIKGLAVGDRIIISDPTRFETYPSIHIN